MAYERWLRLFAIPCLQQMPRRPLRGDAGWDPGAKQNCSLLVANFHPQPEFPASLIFHRVILALVTHWAQTVLSVPGLLHCILEYPDEGCSRQKNQDFIPIRVKISLMCQQTNVSVYVLLIRGGPGGPGPTPNFQKDKNWFVFNKRTIKVCISWFWWCPGTSAPSASHMTLSSFFCSSRSNTQGNQGSIDVY